MQLTVRVRGRGRTRVPAYGIADAEHLVVKELTRLWPGAAVRIEGISRPDAPRIVEEFAVTYRVEGEVEVFAPRPEEAPQAAFRRLRGLLAGSRYHRTEWESLERRE